MLHRQNKTIKLLSALGLVVAAGLPALLAVSVQAAALSQVEVRFDSMQASQFTSGTVCAKPATTGGQTNVVVNFPAGYTVSTTLANWTVSTANLAWPTGGTAWPGIATATNATGQAVTFPSNSLTLGTLYCFNWTNNSTALQVPAAGNYSGTVTTGSDSGSFSTTTIANDQISVSAVVPQAFTFSLSGNTDALGTLSSSAVSSSAIPRYASIDTNAASGWQVWAKDSSSGLRSTATSYTISSAAGSNTTLTSGAEGFVTGVTTSQVSGSGTITVPAGFVGGANRGGGLDTSFRSLASSNGTALTARVTLTNNASISSLTPAATDYTDVITVVGAGMF